jgi:hypothetical protein
VVVVKAKIAVGYNEDGFSSARGLSPSLNGFIVSVNGDGSFGVQFDRNGRGLGVFTVFSRFYGPAFGVDLWIHSSSHENVSLRSSLGFAYGEGPDANETTLFGQRKFRVSNYEVFKIVIQ